MADVIATNGATASLEATSHIPIAQLTPLLGAPSSRSLKATVTLTWPFSSASGSVAFLLAEPDFRLRRTRGQVRVQFSGSSAKAIAKSGIASGDEVTLCLDGVEWLKEDSSTGTPGRGVDCELKFKERLLLQFRREDSLQVSLIDIDHPRVELDPEARQVSSTEDRVLSPEPVEPQTSLSGQPSVVMKTSDNEWSSPAFIKRARTSYGSLFDTDYDPFEEEDGTIPGKGRKRVKSSRLSRKWRYTSRTPSPEVEEPEEPDNIVSPEPTTAIPAAPAMTDEASQTMVLENGNPLDTSTRTSGQYASTAVQVDAGDTDMSLVDDRALTETRQHGIAALTDSSDIQISLPAIPTLQEPSQAFSRQEPLQSDMAQANMGGTVVVPQPPLSPRLDPQSSDGLPLVSPLVESRVGPFGAPPLVELQGFDQSWDGQLGSSVNVEEVSMSNEHKNIYNALPISAAEQPPFGFESFREAAMDLNNVGPLHLEVQANPEHQYGQWQSVNDVASRSISPYKTAGEVGEDYGQQVYDEAHAGGNVLEDQLLGTGDISTTQLSHPEQYPDIGETQLEELGKPSDTGRGSVEYPALPSPNDKFNYSVSQGAKPSPRGSAHISRSQSQQSETVDLTEDSDDEVDEDDDRDTDASFEEDRERQIQEGRDEKLSEDEEYDRDAAASNIDDEEEFEKEEYDGLPMGYRPNGEEEFEGEYEEDYDRPPGYEEDDDNGFNSEEPEDSYDEDEEDEEDDFDDEPPPPPVNREPVFIDLLSSDDEDEPQNTATRGPVQKPIPNVENQEEEYSEDEDSDIDESPHASPRTQNESSAKNAEGLIKKTYQEHDDGNFPLEETGARDDDSDEVDSVGSVESNEDDEDIEMAQSPTRPRKNLDFESVKSTGDDQDVEMDQPQGPSGDREEVESVESVEDDEDDEMAEAQSESGDDVGDIAVAFDRKQQLKPKEDGPENITQKINTGINSGEQINNVGDIGTFEVKPTSSDGKELLLVAENELRQLSDMDMVQTELEISHKDRGEADSFQNEDPSRSGDVDMNEEPGPSLNKDHNLVVLKETVHTRYNKDLEMQPTQVLQPDDETSKEFGDPHPTRKDTRKEGQAEESIGSSQVPAEVSDSASAMEDIHMQQNSAFVSLGMVQAPQDILNRMLKDQLSKAEVAATEQPGFSTEDGAQETSSIPSSNKSRPTPSRRFSLDGVVDDYPEEVVYPILPVDETTQLTLTGPEQPGEDMSLGDEPSKKENAQLPTPDDTQATQTLITETSFTSNASIEFMGGNNDDSSEHITGTVSDAVKIATVGEDIFAGEPETDTTVTAQVETTTIDANIDDAIQQAIREELGDDEETLDPDVGDFAYKGEPPAENLERTKESVEPDGADALPTTPVTPVTPVRRSSRNARTATPGSTRSNLSIILDERPKIKGHDPSVELAMSALSSPAKTDSDVHKPNDTPIKLKSTKALRTEFSEFTSLKLLRFNINKKLDILAVVTTSTPEPQRAKGGPRHYQITFNVTDATIGPSHVSEVQVFRPYKDALPIVKSGDGILLRNFQVISVKGGFALRSDQTESSSWAVFKGKDNEVEVRGPPVEYGTAEKEHIVSLKAWYEGLDDIARTKVDRANGEKGGSTGVRTRAKAAL